MHVVSGRRPLRESGLHFCPPGTDVGSAPQESWHGVALNLHFTAGFPRKENRPKPSQKILPPKDPQQIFVHSLKFHQTNIIIQAYLFHQKNLQQCCIAILGQNCSAFGPCFSDMDFTCPPWWFSIIFLNPSYLGKNNPYQTTIVFGRGGSTLPTTLDDLTCFLHLNPNKWVNFPGSKDLHLLKPTSPSDFRVFWCDIDVPFPVFWNGTFRRFFVSTSLMVSSNL